MTVFPSFEYGSIIKRSHIHDHYGGNRQGGIAASKKYPYIFIFTGEVGEIHGYRDQWVNDNIYAYTGAGQLGDMRMIRGNLALRDHIKNGKRIFLFTQIKKAFVRYECELEFIEFDFFRSPDRTTNDRNAIKFFFKRVGVDLGYSAKEVSKYISDHPLIIDGIDVPNETERNGLVTTRIGQGAYRKGVLHRWKFKCAVTGFDKNSILIASHIVPWKCSTNEERLDIHNGILLSPNYDALFDRHLISFDDKGKILLSKSLEKSNYSVLGVTGNEIIRDLSSNNISFLERHRKEIEF